MNAGEQTRRALLVLLSMALPLCVAPVAAMAQPSTYPDWLGEWRGTVPGIDEIRLTITRVHIDGQIEGRMQFVGNGVAFTFGDTPDTATLTDRGVIAGSTLRIDAAYGGAYNLTRLEPNRLNGTYRRGTDIVVQVRLNKM